MKTKNNRQYANGLLEQPILANTEFIQDTPPIFDKPMLPEISDDRLTAFSVSVYGNYN